MHEGLLETLHASACVTFYKGKPDDNKGDGDGVTELLHTRRQIHTSFPHFVPHPCPSFYFVIFMAQTNSSLSSVMS